MYLVVGATGRIGRHVVAGLRAARAEVRALSRDPERARPAFEPGVSVVGGDLARPDTLPAPLDGVAAVYLASGIGESMPAEHAALYDAAKAAGVRHIVRVSTEAVETDAPFALRRWHAEGERLLEASGLAWTHLRPCNFMHNILTFAREIAETGGFRAPFGEGRMALVDVSDIAAVAVACLTGAGHEGRAYKVTGDDWLTFHEVAEQIGAAIGRPVDYRPVSMEAARAQWAAEGRPDWLVEDLAIMYDLLARDSAPTTTDVVRKVAGKTPVRFADFAKAHAEAFASGAAAPHT